MMVIWAVVLICIFLLPFFSPDVFKIGAHCAYAVLFVCLLFLAIQTKTFIKNRAVLFPLGIWLIIAAITYVFSAYPTATLNNTLYFLFYAAVFVIVAGLDYERKKQIALVFIIGSFLISVRGLLQYFIYFEEILPYIKAQNLPVTDRQFAYISDIAVRRRAISTFTTPNLLASYLVMVNMIIFGYLFVDKDKKALFPLLILLIINSYILWLTRSLAGLASFAFAILLFFVLHSARKKQPPNRLLIFSATAVFILFVALFIRRVFYESGTDNLSISLQGRLQFWKTALCAIADRPLSFAGLGGFGYIYQLYAPASPIESTMAHNLLLQLWIETGLYGLLVFIWFLVALIFTSIRSILKAETPAKVAIFQIGVLSAVSAFLFHDMAGFSFFVPQVAIMWWILCALALNVSK